MTIHGRTKAIVPLYACLALVISLLLIGCTPAADGAGLSDSGAPLTISQSEALASSRFLLAAKGPFVVTIRAGEKEAVDYFTATFTVDPEANRAWGSVAVGPADLALGEQVALSVESYATRSGAAWTVQPASEVPSRAMLLPFSLASDRPDNAQLLRQSDTRYLGSSVLDQRAVDVFRLVDNSGAITSTRLWLDETGGIRRLDAGDDQQVVITLLDDAPEAPPADLDSVLGEANG